MAQTCRFLYRTPGTKSIPVIDDTFDRVVVDGIELDPLAVRTFMAQKALPHLWEHLLPLACTHCGKLHLDSDELAYTPHREHACIHCEKGFFAPGRKKKTIGAPMLALVEQMTQHAVRPPQTHTFVLNGEV